MYVKAGKGIGDGLGLRGGADGRWAGAEDLDVVGIGSLVVGVGCAAGGHLGFVHVEGEAGGREGLLDDVYGLREEWGGDVEVHVIKVGEKSMVLVWAVA